MSDAPHPGTPLAVGDKPSAPTRSKAGKLRTYPLSAFQQRLWVLDQMAKGNRSPNLTLSVRLGGDLQKDALEEALQQLLRRHEALRTTIAVKEGQPVQVVNPPPALILPVVDLSERRPQERAAEADKLAAQQGQHAFDLAQGPSLLPLLLRLGPAEHRLLLTLPFLCADAWSVPVLLRDLAALYEGALTGKPAQLPELACQAGDFALRQQQTLQGQKVADLLAYWKGQLADLPAALELPTDRPRPAVQRYRPAAHSFVLPASLTDGLHRLSRGEGLPLSMTLVAAFQALLKRYSGQDDVAVGTSVPNRHGADLEGVVGFFANHLVLRSDLAGDPSFRELLGRVRGVCLGAFAHQDLPFEQLVEEWQAAPDPSRSPLFQARFLLQNATLPTRQAAGVTFTPLGVEGEPVPCDLSLEMAETHGVLAGRLKYNRDLFEPATAARMVRHFQTLLESAVGNPDQPLSALTLISWEERQRMLVDWNDTRVEFPPAVCLHQMFEAQAAKTPDAVAVVFGEKELSYGELNRRANQLARHLRGLGVGPDVRVALCAERSPEIIVGLFGILKAGGAYVPLDPGIPPERLRFILKDSQAPVLLTQERLLAAMPESNARVVCLDSHWEQIARNEDRDVASGVRPGNLAYVIYTSGSTGRPKGVMVPHRAIGNTLRWRLLDFPMGPDDRVLHTISFDFDASVCATFGPLAAGARLHLLPPGAHRDPGQIVELVHQNRITHLLQPTSMLRVILEERGVDRCTSLRQVFCGGEALTLETQERFFSRLGADLTNLYGPTEIAVDATFWTCRRGAEQTVVPIGRPPANVQVYVLDSHGHPVPVGVPGELYVGGAGLAWGYLNNPALTAERFVPHPFGREPGARLYRTGDLCRWLPDGSLDFLGRVDHQVKIRGVRIEPGEIEAVLGRYAAVREAMVLARDYGPGDRRLVAYVVPQRAHPVTEAELRRYLQDNLPEYMVPAAIVLLEAFPRAPNGKVQLKALPLPAGGADRAYEAPCSPLEHYLAQTWQNILGVPRVGRTDHFFDLGGNSIQGAILIHKLQEKLGEFVYTVAIYDAPTLEGLAGYLSENYPDAVARLFGRESLASARAEEELIDEAKVAALRQVIRTLPPRREPAGPKNPPAIFILSPPRSGSTLSRVMLGGHPRLFAPPELQLLNFNTLAERKAVLATERDRFWLDGTVRALMEIKHCDADEATRIMEDCERRGLTVKEFYRFMQEWLGHAIFVEKTPTYALDLAMLNRAEEDFEDVRYIHLIRHPNAMIASFEEARLHVFFPPFFTGPHPFTARQLAELVWVINHQNILTFLKDIPAHRQHRVYFEELVSNPPKVMAEVANFLGLEFHPNMADPYKEDQKSRMTDAIHPMARMLGDVKFHKHKGVNAKAAERSKEPSRVPLGDITRKLARELGYTLDERRQGSQNGNGTLAGPHKQRPDAARAAVRSTLVGIQSQGSRRPFFCVHPAGGTVFCYTPLARRLGPEQPFYGLQSRGLNGQHEPQRRLEDMAATYIEALRAVQPVGPYALGGWSIGGLVAYEMAQQLQEQGQAVDLLALFDSDFPEKNPPKLDPAKFMIEFALHAGLDASLDRLVRLTPEEQLTLVLDLAKKANLFPPSIEVTEFRKIFRNYGEVFQANILAARQYVPRPSNRRVVLFRAKVTAESVAYEPKWRWTDLVAGVDVHRVDGDHYTILREPQVEALARQLGAHLCPQTGRNGDTRPC